MPGDASHQTALFSTFVSPGILFAYITDKASLSEMEPLPTGGEHVARTIHRKHHSGP